MRTGGGQPAHGTGGQYLSVTFAVPDERTVLLAGWRDGTRSDDATDLLEDAANSLRLALERERALLAQQEAYAAEAVRYERSRIAADLHDIVGHALSLMVVQAVVFSFITWRRLKGSSPARRR